MAIGLDRQRTRRLLAEMAAVSGVHPSRTALDLIQDYRTDLARVADHFKEANWITVPASAPFTRIFSYTVPHGMLGMVEGFGNGVSDNQDWDYLTFAIRVNGASIPGFDLIQAPMGQIPILEPLFWPLFSSQILEVVVSSSYTIELTHVTAAVMGRIFPAAG